MYPKRSFQPQPVPARFAWIATLVVGLCQFPLSSPLRESISQAWIDKLSGHPTETRTPISTLKGWPPSQLEDGTIMKWVNRREKRVILRKILTTAARNNQHPLGRYWRITRNNQQPRLSQGLDEQGPGLNTVFHSLNDTQFNHSRSESLKHGSSSFSIYLYWIFSFHGSL